MSTVHFPSPNVLIDYLVKHPSTSKTDRKIIEKAAALFANQTCSEAKVWEEVISADLARALIDAGNWRDPTDDGR